MNNLKDNQKQYKQVAFEVMEDGTEFTVENQDGLLKNITENEVLSYIDYMIEDGDQFVTLTAPTVIHNIRFVQATLDEEGVHVEIGIVKENKCYMYYKTCNREECERIFFDYFHGKFVANMEEYEPVLFM